MSVSRGDSALESVFESNLAIRRRGEVELAALQYMNIVFNVVC